jgi:hypothetical protein
MEGFWVVQFNGVQGFGAGVVTLMGGQIFGGDSGFLYTGTYTDQAGALNAQIHVRRYAAGMASVMGRDQFDLVLTGTLNGNAIAATGTIPGTPMQFRAQLTRQGNLPR